MRDAPSMTFGEPVPLETDVAQRELLVHFFRRVRRLDFWPQRKRI